MFAGCCGEVLGIIMVGTGVLMSQLLVEYVLDTSQDLDKRLWVYVALFANLGLFAHFGFHMKIIGQHEHGHKIVVRFHLCI